MRNEPNTGERPVHAQGWGSPLLKRAFAAIRVVSMAVGLGGCPRSELAQINPRQLTAEEHAVVDEVTPFANAAAAVVWRYNQAMRQADQAATKAHRDQALRQASSVMAQVRSAIHRRPFEQPTWRWLAPETMTSLVHEYRAIRRLFEREQRYRDVSDQAILHALGRFMQREAEFRTLVSTRPLQPLGHGQSPTFSLYVSAPGVIIEATRGEVYLGATVPFAGLEIQPVYGPIGANEGGTPLRRLVVRDPITRTQRVWMLSGRMPRLLVPAAYVQPIGSDLVITPR